MKRVSYPKFTIANTERKSADESTHLSGVRANVKAARRAILLPNPHKSASIEIVQLPPTIDEYEL